MIDSIDFEQPDQTRQGVDGERLLWATVVWCTMKDISEAKTLREAEKVYRWFHSNMDTVGSFIWVCMELDLSYSYWRARANQILERRKRTGRPVPMGELSHKVHNNAAMPTSLNVVGKH